MSFCRETYRNATKLEACTLKHELCPQTCHRDGIIHSAMFLTLDQTYTVGEVRFGLFKNNCHDIDLKYAFMVIVALLGSQIHHVSFTCAKISWISYTHGSFAEVINWSNVAKRYSISCRL